MSEEQEGQASQNPQPSQPSQPSFNQGNSFPPKNEYLGVVGFQQSLPNATAVLVLGILSILTCCCYGIIGLILGIIALILAKKDKTLYAANLGIYSESSLKNLNAGRICAIIGIVFSAIYLLLNIVFIAIFGFEVLSDQEALKEAILNWQNQ
ncbi:MULTISPECIES: CCC motif membrane protein [Pedobacter]|uniref:CCC motif membrane protein n=1 Tax=Pedobacter helvus TaxID=2563444 RepID=A0ABW9JFP4_9SPHI|nr:MULTISPECIES: CCC motif membrane protein [Pedobacter]WAC39231.1 CCC motif membrane protein [Pedobacter sp. SL55]